MNPASHRPIGWAIFALLCVLVALLALMVAGSKLLVGTARGTPEPWQAPAAIMAVTAVLYAVLAAGCWRQAHWLRWCAPLSLLALVLMAVPEFAREGVLDLAVALVFLLAAATSLALLGYTRLVN